MKLQGKSYMRKQRLWYVGISIAVLALLAPLLWWVIAPRVFPDWAYRQKVKQQASDFIKRTRPIFENSSVFELYSLDGDSNYGDANKPNERFCEWPSYGKMLVNDPGQRKRLINVLYASIESNQGLMASCFQPHHGIHVSDGHHQVDMVICFTCLQIHGTFDGTTISALTTPQPMKYFDEVLKSGGVSLGRRE